MKKIIINIISLFISDKLARDNFKEIYLQKPILKKYKKLLKRKSNYQIHHLTKENIDISVDNIRIKGPSNIVFNPLQEVLFNDEYNFYDKSSNYICIDIGFNIGITSLKMASKENCKHIYSFEPFIPTAIKGEENLNINPELSKKITLHKFGLGCENKEMEVSYNPKAIDAISTTKTEIFKGHKKEKITIKSAKEVLPKILKKHTEKVFMKIDCEGAEFEIIPDLHKSGVLKSVDLIMMEWHYSNPKTLIDILVDNDFICFAAEKTNEIGMIHAVKLKK